MRAEEFVEADLGVHPRRAQRAGSRPARGHAPVPRYRSKEEQLDELTFLGSECTKDCSGHRAGYNWSASRGNRPGNSPYSPSFNKGANLRAAGR